MSGKREALLKKKIGPGQIACNTTSFGPTRHVAIARGLAEFRSGRPVVFRAKHSVIAMPIDGCDASRLNSFSGLSGKAPLGLGITAQRARAIGIETDVALSVDLNSHLSIDEILSIAMRPSIEKALKTHSAESAVVAAIELAKLSNRLPAVITLRLERTTRPKGLIEVDARDVAKFTGYLAKSLKIAASSTIPLDEGSAARMIVFRDAVGSNQTAVIIGQPDFSQPVLVRVHSGCLTGDVFGSRRCDCGDQLKLALSRMRNCGGVILYLKQEGRGLGLVNKIRAYKLQEKGFDTFDANILLGFEDDERDYQVAGRMLQLLGCTSVILLSNNPSKFAALCRVGVKVQGNIPIQAPVTANNRRYLTTLAKRAGHYFDFAS
jgi:GTP cyclohydrolase II